MKLVELTKKEFDQYAFNHPLANFQQTSGWGRFREGESFHSYYIGAMEKGIIVGASLLLSIEVKQVKGRIFYAPWGFLIDYKNEDLLRNFTLEVNKFIEEKNGVFLKIDPYILKQDRNSDGEVVLGGVNNSFIETNLENVGFRKNRNDNIQPKWLSRINLKGKTILDIFSNFSSKARQIVRRNEKFGFKIRELDFTELDKFLDIINFMNRKYNTIGYTKAFFEDLEKCFTNNNLKLMAVYFKKIDVINNLNEEIKNILASKEERITNYKNSKMTEEYFIERELSDEKEIERLNSLISYFYSLTDGEIIMGIYLFILSGNEIVTFQGGMIEEYLKYDASYTLFYEMIKYAIDNNYDYFNLYEIGDITDPNNRLVNSFNFKKNFGGEVVELIGEYNYPIKKEKYDLALKYFPSYLGVKTTYK